jgi:hypothetical protein
MTYGKSVSALITDAIRDELAEDAADPAAFDNRKNEPTIEDAELVITGVKVGHLRERMPEHAFESCLRQTRLRCSSGIWHFKLSSGERFASHSLDAPSLQPHSGEG